MTLLVVVKIEILNEVEMDGVVEIPRIQIIKLSKDPPQKLDPKICF